MGKRVVALLTAMDEPLGAAVGNALEVKEAVALLRGGGPRDLWEVTLELAAEMIVLAGRAPTLDAARAQATAAVKDGRAFRKLQDIVGAQGGDAAALSDLGRLPAASATLEVRAPARGVVQAIDAEAVGLAAVALGAGRARVEDAVDHAVGLVVHRKVGDAVEAGEPLCTIHHGARGAECPEEVAARVLRAYRIGPERVERRPLVLERIG
jgi:thymidine phosphorylase